MNTHSEEDMWDMPSAKPNASGAATPASFFDSTPVSDIVRTVISAFGSWHSFNTLCSILDILI